MAAAFGIDFGKKEVVLFDEGTTRISVSTWPQVGFSLLKYLRRN